MSTGCTWEGIANFHLGLTDQPGGRAQWTSVARAHGKRRASNSGLCLPRVSSLSRCCLVFVSSQSRLSCISVSSLSRLCSCICHCLCLVSVSSLSVSVSALSGLTSHVAPAVSPALHSLASAR